jgi:patatin-like phospholipase/acyl hydrolase
VGIFGSKTVRVLSIDGGGIRGLIPALVLVELRRRLDASGEKRHFSEIFDLLAGTSTGALIALGLALPGRADGASSAFTKKPAFEINEIAEFYARRGIEIFPRHKFESLRAVVQAFGDKYDARNLEKVLDDLFGDATIQDGLTNVLVTSFDTENMEPFFMKRRPQKKGSGPDLNFYMRDAARASSAAPTFFEPALISPLPHNGRRYCLVDGGVFANNPAMCAYVEARKIFPDASRYVVVSLGTGRTKTSFPYHEIRGWGFVDWIRPAKGTPLAAIMEGGQSESANHQLARLPEVEYFRIDGYLDPGMDHVDDASVENIRYLRDVASHFIREQSGTLNKICREIIG